MANGNSKPYSKPPYGAPPPLYRTAPPIMDRPRESEKGRYRARQGPPPSMPDTSANKYGGKDSWDDYDNTNTMMPR